MRQIIEYLSTKVAKPSIIKATNTTIRQIVKDELDRLGHDADLNHIDVSEVKNISRVFSCFVRDLGQRYNDLNPDISQWDVNNAIIMVDMFYGCYNFNCDISSWDVSNVTNMNGMFWNCERFNQDLSRWNVSKVEDMQYMFNGCKNFNQDLSKWNVSNVKYYNFIFTKCPIKKEFKPKFNI